MKYQRILYINNSLVHGICNANCITCNVNKSTFEGPREYQDEKTTRKLIERIEEAAQHGILIGSVDNSGSGECTLHPEFEKRMMLFSNMLKNWSADIKPPRVSVVTNGFDLIERNVLEKIVDKNIDLRVSIPTTNPNNYGMLMKCDSAKGNEYLQKVLDGVGKAMYLLAKKKISKIDFHISPPHYEIVRGDFDNTVKTLSELAYENGVDEINMEMFPALTNRGGKVEISGMRVDFYSDLFRKYDKKRQYGIKCNMYLSNERVFNGLRDYWDILSTFKNPCLFLANLFITPNGETCCCNDQSVQDVLGDIHQHSIKKIMEIRKNTLAKVCEKCSHSPEKCFGIGVLRGYHLLAMLKKKMQK